MQIAFLELTLIRFSGFLENYFLNYDLSILTALAIFASNIRLSTYRLSGVKVGTVLCYIHTCTPNNP